MPTNDVQGGGDMILIRPIQPAPGAPARGYAPVWQKPPLAPRIVEGPPDPDFLTGNYGSAGVWNLTTSGAGAAGSAASNGVDATERALGVLSLQTGTTAVGFASIRQSASGVQLGLMEAQAIVRACVSQVSTGADEFVAAFGFHDTAATGVLHCVDGAYFYYDRATNGDFWCCRTVSHTAQIATTVTTIPVVGGVFSVFEVWCGIDSTGAYRTRFLIDGVQVASHTGVAVPTGAGRQTGLSAMITKTVGLNSRSFLLDSFHYRFSFDTER
jgi:hypothetical protein